MKLKVRMKSLARKPHKLESVPTRQAEPYYPSVGFDSNELPGIEKLKFGDKVHLVLDGEVSSRSMDNYNGKETHRAGFKLKKGAIAHHTVLHNTTEAVDSASKESGGIGRIVKDFTALSRMDA